MSTTQILTITREIHDVLTPVKKTSLKYQCIGVCNEFVCLGATSGSTYVFSRTNGKLVKFFGQKVNAIVALKFSNDEKILAVADSSGIIVCWEVDVVKKEFKIIKEINDFQGTLVTSMCWNESSSRLFVGNKQGLVIAFHVGVVVFYTSETIRKTGDPIVQMDCCQDRLIISSTTKAIVCFLERSQFHQIGKKPRDGQYGICFTKNKNNGELLIYSARPGSRLWKVDSSGQVLATHQFKEALSNPPTPIITSRKISLPESDELWEQPQSFNFPLLIPVMDRFILTWSSCGIYLIDPAIGSAVLWNDQIKEVIGISCTKSCIYILHLDGSVTELLLFTIKECLLELRKLEEWLQLAKVACAHDEEILNNVEMYLSIGFYDVLLKIKENEQTEDDEIVKKFEKFMEEVDARYAEIRAAVQEKMNQMIMNNPDPFNTSDPEASATTGIMDDSDEIRSTASEGMSETSSKISLSRLSEVKDTLVQKATSAVVSKVIRSGFMKKAFRDALESEGVILEKRKGKEQTDEQKHLEVTQAQSASPVSQSVPTSPRQPRSNALERCSSDQMLLQVEPSTTKDSHHSGSGHLQRKTLSSPVLTSDSVEKKFLSNLKVNTEKEAEIIVQRGRKKTKKKKKAKLIQLENTEVQADDEMDDKQTRESKKNSTTKEPSVMQSGSAKDKTNIEAATATMTEEILLSREKALKTITSTTTDGGNTMANVALLLKPPANTSVIVNTLLNSTFSTRKDIRDAGILYNPATFLDKLKRWSKCLARVTAEFREECFRALDNRIQREMNNTILAYLDIHCNNLFFNQCHSAFSEVCNVAMLCLETNAFPEKFSAMKSHEISLLNTEITVDDIMQRASDSVQKIMSAPGNLGIATSNVTEDLQFNVKDHQSEKISRKPEQEPTDIHPPAFTTKFSNVFNKDVKEVLFDKHSLSTIASESNTDCSGDGSMIDSIDVLVENPLLCENLNKSVDEPCEQCAIDKCRACFVLRYFAVVNFARIRALLSWSSKCRWRTWLACVVRLKQSHRISDLAKLLASANTSDLSILNEVKETDVKIVLAYSPEINNRSSELMIECAALKNLAPWETTLLFYTGILGSKPPSTNVDAFLSYANEAIGNVKLETVFAKCVLDSALQDRPDMQLLFCSSCGQARPGSNRLEWRWDSLLKKLVENLLSTSKSTKDMTMLLKFSDVCLKSAYWYGYVHLVNKCPNNTKKVIGLLCQLADFELLASLSNDNGIVYSEDEWSLLLHEYTERHNTEHKCLPIEGSLPSMSVEKIVKLIAMHAGPRFALTCLKDVVKTPEESSYLTLYPSLLQALQLENEQESIISKLIEVASANVWSKSKSVIPHELEVIKEAELRGTELITPSAVHDNRDAVWGRNISISSAECPVCTLPLCLKSSHSSVSAALIVFQCGHSFHKICVPENACLVCYYDNFATLF